MIPVRRKLNHRIPWESDSIIVKRENLKKASIEKNQNPSRENRYQFRRAQNGLKQTNQIEQETYVQSKIDLINNAAINKQAALAWQTVKEISGRKSSNQAELKAANQRERIEKWKDHFENLLGKAPSILQKEITKVKERDLDIRKGLFSLKELKTAKRQIKRGKACGLDNIPAEVWLTGSFDEELLSFCNSVYQQNPIDR